MSELPSGGYNPHPPVSANERKLSNYFGSSELSSDNSNPFAFATEGTNFKTDFQQLTTPLVNPLPSKSPGYTNAPPTATIPRTEPMVHQPPVGIASQPNYPFHTLSEQNGGPIIAHPPPPTGSMTDSLVPVPRDSFLPQTGHPPSHSLHYPMSDSFPSHTIHSLVPLPEENASTLPFTGQLVKTHDSQSFNQQFYTNNSETATNNASSTSSTTKAYQRDNVQVFVPSSNSSEMFPIGPTEFVHDNNVPHSSSSLGEASDKSFNQIGTTNEPQHSSTQIPVGMTTRHPFSDPNIPSDQQTYCQQCELWTPSTHSHTSERSPDLLFPQNTSPSTVPHSDKETVQTGHMPYRQMTPTCRSEEQEHDRIFSYATSLTGSNISTGTNTPLPPVAALPLYHSHSVPINLHGAAEKLTNAHLIPRHNCTNAGWQISEAPEITSMPSNIEHYSSKNYTLLPSQNIGFSIGPIQDVDESDFSLVQPSNKQAITAMKEEERAVIGEDSPLDSLTTPERNEEKEAIVSPLDPTVEAPFKQINNTIEATTNIIGSQTIAGITGSQTTASTTGSQTTANSNGSQTTANNNIIDSQTTANNITGSQTTASTTGSQTTANSNGSQTTANNNIIDSQTTANNITGSQTTASTTGSQTTANSNGSQTTANNIIGSQTTVSIVGSQTTANSNIIDSQTTASIIGSQTTASINTTTTPFSNNAVNTSIPAGYNNGSQPLAATTSAPVPSTLNNIMTPFIPTPSTVGINTETKTIASNSSSTIRPEMEQEKDMHVLEPERKPEGFRPDGQGQPPVMLPSILSAPPTVDLTLRSSQQPVSHQTAQLEQWKPYQLDQPPSQLDHPPQFEQAHSHPPQSEQPRSHAPQLEQPQSNSLQCSSTSAFSSPQSSLLVSQSIHPPLPPVVQLHTKRNSLVTNADILDQQTQLSAGLPIQQPVMSHAPDSRPVTNAIREDKVEEQREETSSKSSRTQLSGQERIEYESYQRDHDYYNRRGHYDHGRDEDYYHNNRHYYRPEDRPHSRMAYQYDQRDNNYPEKNYYGNDYRDERRNRHYNSYYDDRDHYWRQDYYHDYDRQHHYDRYHQDPRYRDQYYNNYYYPDERTREYEGYPPPPSSDQSYSRQNYQENVTTLPDESSIYGHHDSSYLNSPGSQYHHGEYNPHESTRIDQPDYGNEYRHDHYTNTGQYPPNVGERYPIEGYRQDEEEPFRPIQGSPPPPVRETPLPFAHPHVSVRFGIGGHLVTVIPVVPTEHTSAVVEIHSLKNLIPQASQLSERISSLPGPLLPGETSKSAVIKYVTQKSEECIQVSQDHELSVHDRDVAGDDALLWHFLALMCQQNGVLVPSDISDLLMKEASLPTAKSPVRGVGVGGVKETEDYALNEFRHFLLSGRKKDALELACRRALWGHALMLSSRMDDQSRTYVVNRFTASLPTTDPLNTFYTMMLGRTPSVVRPEGLGRAGDWRSHLAMIVANNQDKNSINTLGDSLLSQGRIYAAHLCYHLSGQQLGATNHDNTSLNKYSLLGIKTPCNGVFLSEPEDLCRTEVFEYALGLSRTDFTLPSFQTHKLLHTIKLFESGLLEKALRYCESIAYYVTRDVRKYNQTFLMSLQELSTRLHHASCPLGVMEMELPSWIIQLEQSMNDATVESHTPPVSRDSPSLASASNLTTQEQQQHPFSSTQENTYGSTFLQVPPITVTNNMIPELEQTGSKTSLASHTNIAQPTEQEYGLQYENQTYEQEYGHQYQNQTYEQQPNNNEQPIPMMGGATYGMGVVSNTEQVDAGINTMYANQPQPVAENIVNNQFVGDSWPSYGHYQQENEGYNNNNNNTVNNSNTLQHNTQTADSAAVGYTNETIPQDGGSDVKREEQPPMMMGCGVQSDLQTGTSPPYFGSLPEQVPEKEEEREESVDEKEEEKMNDNKKKESANANKQGQSGWLGGILNWIPKGKNRAHLPKDKDKRIVFDKEKNKWINLDEDEAEDSQPTAPPTDNELMSQKPVAVSNSTSDSQTDGSSVPPPSSNLYSRSRLGKGGRLGTRSMYVDVLNPGGPKQANPSVSGPPPPSLMPPMMSSSSSLGPTNMNPSNFFTGSSNASSEGVKETASMDTPPVQTQSQSLSQNVPPSKPMTIPSQLPSSRPHQVSTQEDDPPKSAGSSTSIEFGEMDTKNEQPQPTPFPQFFNPNAFSSMPNQMPGVMISQQQQPNKSKDPFPDNVSEVSEYSLEVSRINKQASSHSRSRYQYPTAAAGPMTNRPQYPAANTRPTGGQPRPPPGGNWL